jgi:DNA primase
MQLFLKRRTAMADFQLIKEQVTIEAAAQFLNLELRSQGAALRGACLACKTGGDRALVVTPSKGLFYCFSAGIGGDLITLWGHIEKCSPADSGRQIADTFGVGNGGTSAPVRTSAPVHSPKADRSPNEKREPTRQFDPNDYLSKLTYSEELEALGISEADAQALGIGFVNTGLHRGRIAIALRWPSGEIAGFGSVEGGTIKLPNKFIPPKVHVLKRA